MTTTAPKNLLLRALPPLEYRRLARALERVSLKRWDQIWEPGTDIPSVYFPETCMVSVVATMKNGSTAEVGVIGREGTTGFPLILGVPTIPTEAFIQVPGEALRIPSQAFLELLKTNPRAHRLVLQYSYTLFHQAARSAACNLFHTIKHRCAKWLLMTWERVGKAEFNLTHEFLAEMLGSRRAGVSRAAFQLRSAGLIDYRNGKMRIRDVDGLKKVSCECFLIIQKEAMQVFRVGAG